MLVLRTFPELLGRFVPKLVETYVQTVTFIYIDCSICLIQAITFLSLYDILM